MARQLRTNTLRAGGTGHRRRLVPIPDMFHEDGSEIAHDLTEVCSQRRTERSRL